MFGKKNVLVIWVSGNQLTLVGGKLTAGERIALPAGVVAHQEILDPDALSALVKDWAGKHPAAEGTEIVWIYGPDVYFEHVMAEGEQETWEHVVTRFLDLLPFEEVVSRTYKSARGTKVVAMNKELVLGLARAFAMQGYTTRAELVSGEVGKLGAVTAMDANVVRYITGNLDEVEKGRVELTGGQEEWQEQEPAGPKPKSSLPLLLAVFGILLAILVVVYLRAS